ncbi:MAG: hypothetical protein ACP5GS_06925 [Nitrososphaeria archaeon]
MVSTDVAIRYISEREKGSVYALGTPAFKSELQELRHKVSP